MIDDTNAEDTSTKSSSKSGSHLSPSTPNLGSSFVRLPLLLHEEATKKLYEGLGIGRHPLPAAPILAVTVLQRMLTLLSQPVRQSRRPPFGADELGPCNFATHIHCEASGDLGC